MSNFETHPKKLKEELLNSIDTRETALPDFQRDFVWQPGQTKGLIVSLAKRYPAGSLLRLESSDPMFKARAFAGAPELNGHKPKYLILDGQQRLTSLYQALYGTGEHSYFVSFRHFFGGKDVEEAFFFERNDRATHYYDTMEKQARWGVLPLNVIFGGEGFHSWLRKIRRTISQLESDGKQVGFASDDETADKLEALYTQWVEPIVKYEFPVVTLSETTSLEAVCTIFETLNNTGVRLSVFDLLSARFFAKGQNLRKLWEEAQDSSAYLKDFDVDPYYILQAICTLVSKSAKRSDVLKLSPDAVEKHWEDVLWGMNEALDVLYSECGVLKPSLLSYNTLLVPLAAIFATFRNLSGPAKGTFRSKIKRFYWCSVFGQAYESNPTTQAITDYNEFSQWMAGGKPPESVAEFSFDGQRLYTTTTRQRAVYRGVLCLLLQRQPMDFHSTKPLSAGVMADNHVDDHHIFPDAYLRETRKLPQQEIDAVVNRTLIDRETNQRIGKNPPSTYLKRIEQEWQNTTLLDDVLASHLLPTGEASSLQRNDFDKFREERAQALYQLITDATC